MSKSEGCNKEQVSANGSGGTMSNWIGIWVVIVEACRTAHPPSMTPGAQQQYMGGSPKHKSQRG